jgi:hypothetical protein
MMSYVLSYQGTKTHLSLHSNLSLYKACTAKAAAAVKIHATPRHEFWMKHFSAISAEHLLLFACNIEFKGDL